MPNARLLGEAANTAYQSSETCRKWAQGNGFNEDFDFFSNFGPKTDTNGFVAQNATTVLVAFRGTNPRERIDWIIDFNALKDKGAFPGAQVHEGFFDALGAVWGQTLSGKQILPGRLLNRGNRAVWITGHSLGGALAELAAARTILESGIPVQGVYTFGQPRVGNDAFARKMETPLGSRIFRFINNLDIVPRVPLYGMGYRHYGTEIFFNNKQQQEDRPATIEGLLGAVRLALLGVNLTLADELAKLTLALVTDNNAVTKREFELLGNPKAVLAAGIANIADHSMENSYLPRLVAALGGAATTAQA
ncbi:MAG TPA: lipase family protein [Bryobacteraceae bacterium]|nr:lipase family protein [Bryobacteraceae bacterium]